jgi:hypothetical protein
LMTVTAVGGRSDMVYRLATSPVSIPIAAK